MRRMLVLVAMLMLVAGCGRREEKATEPTEVKPSTDAELRQMLVGKWSEDLGPDVLSENTFNADGSFFSYSERHHGDGVLKTTYKGTWEVTDGVLVYHVTECSRPQLLEKVRLVEDRLDKVERERFVYTNKTTGRTVVAHRVE